MNRVVVTGSTGTIGIALVQKLVEMDMEVFAVCRPKSNRLKSLIQHKNIHIVQCDLENLDILPSLIGKTCDAFFHLAWEGTLNPENRFDMYLQNKNVRLSLDAVKAAHDLSCEVFVGAGSQAEYGTKAGIMRPDTYPDPVSGYGMAKLCAGQMTRYMCAQYGMRHVWPRILSVYGIGDGNQTFISMAILKMLEGKRFSMTMGEQVWDYLYSEDAAEALIAMAEKGRDGAVYVVGSGQTMKLKEYVNIIRNKINPNLEIGFGDIPYNEDQVMYLKADYRTLTEDTGWYPKVRFEEGITMVIKAAKNNLLM